MAQKVILDVDTGVDDTMALLFAALHESVDLVAAGSVWGNVDVETATRNTLNVLAMAGRPEVPVAAGAAGPISGEPAFYAYHVHGRDGQGNRGMAAAYGRPVAGTAAEQIVRLCREQPGEIELVAVGPLTNLALALQLAPDLPQLVHGVTIMGGAALVPGNVSEVAEANIHHDADAAALVFAADWPLTMVGLDVTMRVVLDAADIARLAEGGTIAEYLHRIVPFYADYFAETAFGTPISCMHDVVAVAVASGALVPELAPTVRAQVDDTDGPGRGQTLCDLRGMYMGYPAQDGARCRVVLRVDDAWGSRDFVTWLNGAGDAAVDTSEGASA